MGDEDERMASEEPQGEDKHGSESSMRVPGTGLGALAQALASNARKMGQPPQAPTKPEPEPLAGPAPGKAAGSRKRKRGQPRQAAEVSVAAASGSGEPLAFSVPRGRFKDVRSLAELGWGCRWVAARQR